MKNFNQFISLKQIVAFITFLTVSSLFGLKAQSDVEQVFTNVPLVNGKVVFQQYVHTDNAMTADQKYALLYKWGKDNFAGNPLLSGIRFDEKSKSITVSSKVELILPADSQGERKKMLMNYKLESSITNAGCMIKVRDITYQNVDERGKNIFPKTVGAESCITDNAVNSAPADEKELRQNTRKSTLYFLNGLYGELKNVFTLK